YTLSEVTLRVLDKNDEKPVFKNVPSPFLATVSDSPGGEGKFEIFTEEDFGSGEMVGKIMTTVNGPGQFPQGAEYTLVVSAQDMAAGLSPAQKSEFAIVKVLVGLRPPQLFENPFYAKVDETSGTGTRILGVDDRILKIRAKLFQDTVSNVTEFNLTDQNGKLSSLFSINRQGNVETLQNLDYEEPPNQYVLNVTVTEKETRLSTTGQLIINVQDINDNSPKFQLSTYTATVPEDIPVGSPLSMREQVIATDRDSGLNGELEYFVSDPHFSIKTVYQDNQYVGRISIAKKLDYDNETAHQYSFTVTARDQGEIPQSGMATVIVYVSNVNDEAPVFGTGSEYQYASISEEQTIGSVVTIVQATDPDGDNVKYYFKPKDRESYPFEIDPDSGLIKLIGPLPDSIPYYTLNITAYDDGACCGRVNSLSSDSYVVVEVKDTNNNQPQFPSCNYEPEVQENQDVGTFVVQVKAVDNDRGANGNITYSIIRTPLQSEQFAVDPVNGRVVTAIRFDREVLNGDRRIPVTVKAADQGTPQSLEKHCTFWVVIGDVNDNQPQFDSPSYSTSMSESSATVGRRVFAVRASDADHGLNAEVVYSLVHNPGEFFRIESDTGIIYLDKSVYGIDKVLIRVKAEDRGSPPLSSFVSVDIGITDRNNNPPTWESNTYEREYVVKETAQIAYVIASMGAQSNTPAPFDGLSFALIDSQENTVQQLGPFRIQQDGNTVTLVLKGQLDYNVKNRYELRLRVTNQGQTPLSSEIRPIVVVKDMNNEPPQFRGLDINFSNSYTGIVPENEPPGQTVIQIKAEDPDHDPPNNVVRYSLMQDPNDAYMHFNIDEVSGVITTRSQFDREEQSVYYIKVKAVDGKNSDAPGHFPENTPNSATASVQVMISDKNDNPPYFIKDSWEITVPERRPDSNSAIITVVATDKDKEDTLSYTITEGNLNNVFGIKQKTGDIYVAKTLDYETPPTEYKLRVIVQDGRFEGSTEVIVKVTDVNDNAPEFSQKVYEVNSVVEERVPPPGGQLLVQVSATDKDVSRDSNFRYSISGEGTDPNNPTFKIEPDTGRVFLLKPLDRDLPSGRDVYQFNVLAEDEPSTANALTGFSYVKVKPQDINDNAPVFKESDLQGAVPEHSDKDHSVMTIVATDYDAGDNGTVIYEIDAYGNPPAAPTGEYLFKINSNGLIKTNLNNSLDREKTSVYYLPIVAKDKGAEQRKSTATATISILDINDQKPQFIDKIYKVTMSENQKTGPVKTVTAIDRDIDENARLTYTLKDSDRTYFFIETIPPNAGVLKVFREVDYEKVRFFNLTVYVQDSDPSHRDVAYIEVTVEDYNDNAPVFDPKVMNIRHRENIPIGTSLWNCSATDKDDGINKDFQYKIDRRTDPGRRFTVTSNCEVTVKRGLDGQTLDREALVGSEDEKYEVHVLAVDKGYPPQTGTATLRIFVDDVNDNAPQLVYDGVPMVMELEDPPRFVVAFSAVDPDTPQYGAPFQFSLPPCDENPTCNNGDLDFTMDFLPNGDNGRGSGFVTAMKKFYREKQKYHYLPIIISDMRGTGSQLSKTGTSTLTIEIGDKNNHPHSDGYKEIFMYKYDFKGVTDDLVIGSVYAPDLDDWDVVDKHYYFYSPPEMARFFSIDYDDGLIRMNKDTPPGVYDFKAKVHDYVVFTHINATASVRVIVEEITDDAIFSSGSLRFIGMTAEEFITQPNNGKSPYEKFKTLLASKLSVPQRNVAIFSVMNGQGREYVEIRYAAHGSPYYPPSKLDGIIALDKDQFAKDAGIKIIMVNVDMCLQETCESGGCSNILKVADTPNYVNANGTSFVGVGTSVVAECVCAATDFSAPVGCSPTYCLNGGQCVNCPEGFDGPRCQMTRHSLSKGYALYAPLSQCEESVTSIEFIAKDPNGLIFYNGPVDELGIDDPTDYIALSLVDGYPELQVDHGSGVLTLTVDGRDQKGERYLQKLDDGRWHHIDIIRKGKTVTLTVDRCDMLDVNLIQDSAVDRSPCEVTGSSPGDNMFLNVNAMLQLGGRYATPSYPTAVRGNRYQGCVRNLVHNGQLYDLYTGPYSKGENHENGCSDEDEVCGVSSPGGPLCGPHGICELTDMINAHFLGWTLKHQFLNADLTTRQTEIQVRFRTRDPDGILLHLPSNTQEFITLELVQGRVQLLYNLGGSSGESVLSLTEARASNGQWHTVHMRRIGRWFELKMDGGEGRYRNETWGSLGGRELIQIDMYGIVSGANVVFRTKPVVHSQDLNETCITDVRLNGKWFPMVRSENERSETATLEYEYHVENDCVREDCAGVICPSGSPFSAVCFPLWGIHECSGYNCFPIDYCERDTPCFEDAECITKAYPDNFTCVCPPRWTGRLCDIQGPGPVVMAGLTTSFIIIIIISIFRRTDPEKYILEIDPDDDIRENVMNYNEEGAGEEDEDCYDISRLRKPDEMDTFRPINRRLYGKIAPGERPDVGDFIEHRLDNADNDPSAPPHDSVREFVYEGGGSDAGSLSSLQTSSGSEDQDYQYLDDWGHKFAKLANMYGGEDDLLNTYTAKDNSAVKPSCVSVIKNIGQTVAFVINKLTINICAGFYPVFKQMKSTIFKVDLDKSFMRRKFILFGIHTFVVRAVCVNVTKVMEKLQIHSKATHTWNFNVFCMYVHAMLCYRLVGNGVIEN
ncbi:CADN-like protein, partial [Mya arenaria]